MQKGGGEAGKMCTMTMEEKEYLKITKDIIMYEMNSSLTSPLQGNVWGFWSDDVISGNNKKA